MMVQFVNVQPIWNRQFKKNIYSCVIANLIGDPAPEIIGCSFSKQMKAFDLKGNVVFLTEFSPSITCLKIASISKKDTIELISGSLDGLVYVMDSKGNPIWTSKLNSPVICMETGDLIDDIRNEVIVGLENHKLIGLDNEGNIFLEYDAPESIVDCTIGDFSDNYLGKIFVLLKSGKIINIDNEGHSELVFQLQNQPLCLTFTDFYDFPILIVGDKSGLLTVLNSNEEIKGEFEIGVKVSCLDTFTYSSDRKKNIFLVAAAKNIITLFKLNVENREEKLPKPEETVYLQSQSQVPTTNNINENDSIPEIEQSKTNENVQLPPFKAYKGEKPFIFVSYSHLDKATIYPIIKSMHDLGILIWYNEGIPMSEKWLKIIAENINKCGRFLVFISNNSVKSENVMNEIGYALERYKKGEIQFTPIYIEETEIPDELKLATGRIQVLLKYKMSEEMFYSKLKEQLASFVDLGEVTITERPFIIKQEEKPGRIEKSEKKLKKRDEQLPNVHVYRGGQIKGGEYLFKIKVINDGKYNITDVNIQILSYPEESLVLSRIDGHSKITPDRVKFHKISKGGGFVSPSFIFKPKKDCIKGTVLAVISFINEEDQIETINVEPHEIRMICGLLKPKIITNNDFERITKDLKIFKQIGDEITVPYKVDQLYQKLIVLLKNKNFAIIDTEKQEDNNKFRGFIKGFAEGTYSKNSIGLKITIMGDKNSQTSTYRVDIFAEDEEMSPSIISEFENAVKPQICPECGVNLPIELKKKIMKGISAFCEVCGSKLLEIDIEEKK